MDSSVKGECARAKTLGLRTFAKFDELTAISAVLMRRLNETAVVKMVADLHPSLCHLSKMLALTPRPVPRWVRDGETIVERTIPYLRGRLGMKPGASM